MISETSTLMGATKSCQASLSAEYWSSLVRMLSVIMARRVQIASKERHGNSSGTN
jgi:hypothetical protein